MNKKVLYKNKCRIDLLETKDFLEKYKPHDLYGKRILAVQSNKLIVSGICGLHPDFIYFFNYNDHKFESYDHLCQLKDLDDADPNLYDYKEYRDTIEKRESCYTAVKYLIDGLGIDYAVVLDDLEILIDADDEPFAPNVLNLLTYDNTIDYYSRGNVICVQEDCKATELQTMSFYPSVSMKNNHFIEYQDFVFYDSMQYLNFYFNIDFYCKDEKLDLIS